MSREHDPGQGDCGAGCEPPHNNPSRARTGNDYVKGGYVTAAVAEFEGHDLVANAYATLIEERPDLFSYGEMPPDQDPTWLAVLAGFKIAYELYESSEADLRAMKDAIQTVLDR